MSEFKDMISIEEIKERHSKLIEIEMLRLECEKARLNSMMRSYQKDVDLYTKEDLIEKFLIHLIENLYKGFGLLDKNVNLFKDSDFLETKTGRDLADEINEIIIDLNKNYSCDIEKLLEKEIQLEPVELKEAIKKYPHLINLDKELKEYVNLKNIKLRKFLENYNDLSINWDSVFPNNELEEGYLASEICTMDEEYDPVKIDDKQRIKNILFFRKKLLNNFLRGQFYWVTKEEKELND